MLAQRIILKVGKDVAAFHLDSRPAFAELEDHLADHASESGGDTDFHHSRLAALRLARGLYRVTGLYE